MVQSAHKSTQGSVPNANPSKYLSHIRFMDLNDRIHMLKACKVERKRMIMKMQTPGILLLCKDITREALPTLHQTPLNITFVPKMDCLQHELETEWNPFSYRWFLVSLPTMENVRKVSIEMRSGARSSYILGQYQEVWRIIKMFCSTWKQMDSKLEELKVRIRGTKEWKIEDQAWTIPGSQKKMLRRIPRIPVSRYSEDDEHMIEYLDEQAKLGHITAFHTID